MEPWKRLQYAEDAYTYKHWTKLVSWGKSRGISGLFYEKKGGCCWYRLSRRWTAKKNEWGNSYFGNSVIKLTEIAETPVILLSKYCCSLSGYFEKKIGQLPSHRSYCAFEMHSVMLSSWETSVEFGAQHADTG